MIILSIDPAISCGWCIGSINSEIDTFTIMDCGHFEITKSEYSGDMCLDIQKQVSTLFDKYTIDEMVIEDYVFSGRKCQGAHLNLYIRGALHMLCRTHNKPYTIASISNWKAIIAGRSMPPNEMKKFYGKELANKVFIQEALWVRYNIRFPNHSISQKTNKPISIKYDMIDAVAIGIAHAYSKYNIKNVNNTKTFPDDIPKMTKTKQYTYTI